MTYECLTQQPLPIGRGIALASPDFRIYPYERGNNPSYCQERANKMSNTIIINQYEKKNGGFIITISDEYMETFHNSNRSYSTWNEFYEDNANDIGVYFDGSPHSLEDAMENYTDTPIELYLEEELVDSVVWQEEE